METIVLVVPRSAVEISDLSLALEPEDVAVSGSGPVRFALGGSHGFIRLVEDVVEDGVFDEDWDGREMPKEFTVFAVDYRDRHLVSEIVSKLDMRIGEYWIDTNNGKIVSSSEPLEPYLP